MGGIRMGRVVTTGWDKWCQNRTRGIKVGWVVSEWNERCQGEKMAVILIRRGSYKSWIVKLVYTVYNILYDVTYPRRIVEGVIKISIPLHLQMCDSTRPVTVLKVCQHHPIDNNLCTTITLVKQKLNTFNKLRTLFTFFNVIIAIMYSTF